MSEIIKSNRYSWDDKVQVATLYMQLGNARLVSEKSGVAYQTILDWRRTDWWIDLCDELKQIKRTKTGVKLAEIIEESIAVVQDRLANGDIVLNVKTGELIRRPVSLRDAAQVTNNLITRQIQMEELAEKLVNRKESIKETIAVLAKEFAKFNQQQAKAKAHTIQYVEVVSQRDTHDSTEVEEVVQETTDAVHEKWEEGLQEGGGEVHLETSGQEKEG